MYLISNSHPMAYYLISPISLRWKFHVFSFFSEEKRGRFSALVYRFCGLETITRTFEVRLKTFYQLDLCNCEKSHCSTFRKYIF